jgi:hypothetical protein
MFFGMLQLLMCSPTLVPVAVADVWLAADALTKTNMKRI